MFITTSTKKRFEQKSLAEKGELENHVKGVVEKKLQDSVFLPFFEGLQVCFFSKEVKPRFHTEQIDA